MRQTAMLIQQSETRMAEGLGELSVRCCKWQPRIWLVVWNMLLFLLMKQLQKPKFFMGLIKYKHQTDTRIENMWAEKGAFKLKLRSFWNKTQNVWPKSNWLVILPNDKEMCVNFWLLRKSLFCYLPNRKTLVTLTLNSKSLVLFKVMCLFIQTHCFNGGYLMPW